MNGFFLSLNLLLVAAVSAGNYFYQTVGGTNLKGLTSLGFVLIGVINLFYAIKNKAPLRFPLVLSIGLVLAMTGDIGINYHFVFGAALFAFGHLFFFGALCLLHPFHVRDLIPSVVLLLFCTWLIHLSPFFHFESRELPTICLGYGLILSVMLGKAIMNALHSFSLINGILALGALFFFFSDLMLVFAWFSIRIPQAGTLCMATYYPSVCLIAFSGYCYVRSQIRPVSINR